MSVALFEDKPNKMSNVKTSGLDLFSKELDLNNVYTEALNLHTAKCIIEALELTSVPKEITIIFLFSGVTPDCEFNICKLLSHNKDIKKNIFCNIILIDSFNPLRNTHYYEEKYQQQCGIKTLLATDCKTLNTQIQTHMILNNLQNTVFLDPSLTKVSPILRLKIQKNII